MKGSILFYQPRRPVYNLSGQCSLSQDSPSEVDSGIPSEIGVLQGDVKQLTGCLEPAEVRARIGRNQEKLKQHTYRSVNIHKPVFTRTDLTLRSGDFRV